MSRDCTPRFVAPGPVSVEGTFRLDSAGGSVIATPGPLPKRVRSRTTERRTGDGESWRLEKSASAELEMKVSRKSETAARERQADYLPLTESWKTLPAQQVDPRVLSGSKTSSGCLDLRLLAGWMDGRWLAVGCRGRRGSVAGSPFR